MGLPLIITEVSYCIWNLPRAVCREIHLYNHVTRILAFKPRERVFAGRYLDGILTSVFGCLGNISDGTYLFFLHHF